MNLRCVAVLTIVLAASPGEAAEPIAHWSAEQVIYDQDSEALELVVDEAAAGKRALEVRVQAFDVREGEGMEMLRTPATGELPDGRYRATFRLRVQGMLHSLGTAINLEVHGEGDAGKASPAWMTRTVYPNEFNAEDEYQEFALDFDIRPPYLQRVAMDEEAQSRFLMRWEHFLMATAGPAHKKNSIIDGLGDEMREGIRMLLKQHLDEHSGKPMPPALPNLPASARLIGSLHGYDGSPRKVFLSISLPANFSGPHGLRGNSTPYPSLRRLTADTIRVERVPETTLAIRDFQAQYAWRRPGEPQRFHLELHNRSGNPVKASLRLRVLSGLTGSIEIPAPTVELADQSYQAFDMDWAIPLDHPLWGQEAVMEAVVGDQVVATARAWFTVQSRVVPVMICTGRSYGASESVRWIDPTATKPNVGNLEEVFAPTPYDSAGIVPDDPEKPFLRGNSGTIDSLPRQAMLVRRNLEQGIATVFYLEAHGTGLRAWDLYFDNPDQVAAGSLPGTSDIFLLKRMAAEKQLEDWFASDGKSEPPKEFPGVGYVMFNSFFKEVVDRCIAGHIAMMRHVPYAGVRWDTARPLLAYGQDVLGQDLGKTPEELTAVSVANVTRYLAEIRAAHPHFEVGINLNHGELMGKVADPFDFAAARAVIDRDPVVKTLLADQGYILEEGWGHSFESWNDYKYNCRNYLRANRYEDAAYKYAGGHHGHMFRDNEVQYTPDDIYQQVFSLLGGAHLCYVNYGPLPESRYDLGVYAARFSEFFWDPALRPLEQVEEKFEVDTEAEIWISETGFEKETAAGNRIYVLPVINPPVTETWLKNRYGLLPAPIRGPLPMRVKIPKGYGRAAGVYHLENSPCPTVRPLAMENEDDAVVFELPELVTFEVVVVEFAK